MTSIAVQQPCQPSDIRVELLRDAKGVYGIGTTGTVGVSNGAERTSRDGCHDGPPCKRPPQAPDRSI